MDNFKIGDNVRLISGGPEMTVCYLKSKSDDDYVSCQWFNKNVNGEYQLKEEKFHKDTITKV